MIDLPLVSLCIITYNSSKTVLELLESAKAQTYKNIELIVSDDCSTDNTITVVRQWLDENNSFFYNTRIVSTSHNCGVSGNFNNAIRHARGVWVKCIAGDDLLLPTCIEDNVNYIAAHPDTNILFSLPQSFRVINGVKVFEEDSREADWKKWNKLTIEEKQRVLIDHCALSSPTTFINRTFALNHPYDEDIPFLEDWPYMFNLISQGINLPLLSKHTILYRISDGSLIHQKNIFYSERMDMSERLFWYKYRMWELRDENAELYDFMMKYFLIHDIQDGLFHNCPNFMKKVMNKIIVWLITHFCHFDMKRTMMTVNTKSQLL